MGCTEVVSVVGKVSVTGDEVALLCDEVVIVATVEVAGKELEPTAEEVCESGNEVVLTVGKLSVGVT